MQQEHFSLYPWLSNTFPLTNQTLMKHPDEYETLSPSEAIAYQKELRTKINLQDLNSPITTIGGADISFNKFSEVIYAGIIVLSFPDMKIIDRETIISTTKFPYISGLLAFREIPALLKVWNNLTIKPDVLVLDGQGIAHQRRTGVATHFGIIANTPTIGCAKSRLTGTFTEPGNIPLNSSPLYDKADEIGTVLRTKRNCKPVFISPGHLITLQQSVQIISQCIKKHRIPEPTRLAHLLVNQLRTSS